jgi:AdoMet-dependent rRNA methyltransferase SPB1
LAKAVEKAKRLANRIAEDTDMSTRSKMRAIEKAMGKSRVQKTGSVTVRVTRSNGARSSGKGKDKSVRVKFADKRMRSDQRGMDRAMKGGKGLNKRRKGGGKGKHRSRHFN